MNNEAVTNNSKSAVNLLQTRQHFEVLDGLRGVAALAVVIFHFMEFAVPDYADSFIGHGYLAVDFFFCLSGFVIAYAYDNRMTKIGAAQFFRLRLIRLQPLVIIGSVIGLLTFIFDPYHNFTEAFGVAKTGLVFLASCLMIPFPVLPERYNNLFHLNPPTWSLMWEYIANIFYAFILYKINKRVLWALTGMAAVLLFITAYHYGNLSIGWGADNYTGGSVRVFFSFLAGILVYRSQWIIRSSIGFLLMSLLLLMAFLFPFVNGINIITEPLVVILCFPCLIALGAGAHLTSRFHSVCTFSGNLSYPLYMVHYPFLWLFMSYMEVEKPAMSQLKIIIPVAVVLLIVFAYLVMIFLDMPVRAYLTRKLKKNLIMQ